MEIIRTRRDGILELIVDGRLDLYWAEHLNTAVQDVLREGTHAVRINLSGATYISSAGIGTLVRLHQQFQTVNGSFLVIEPSTAVLNVLKLARVADILTGSGTAAVSKAPVEVGAPVERRETGGAIFEIHRIDARATLSCGLMGDPSKLPSAGFTAEAYRNLPVKQDRLAIGVGGLGDNFDGCRDRFGEFLTVAGGAASQPTDGTNFPDYMLGSDTFAPQLAMLYGLYCDGGFGTLVRFENATGNDPLPLSLIVRTCLEISGAPTAGVVVLAESAGLMGASLKRSPVEQARVFAYPEIRQWVNFSPERAFPHTLALIAGLATSAAPEPLRPFVRPISTALEGHFHAAVFNYRPLQKGRLEMKSAIHSLFDAGGLLAVMHLLSDDRHLSGGGESELLRGACWVSPVRDIVRGEATA